jgi:hypothetical protein
MPSEIAITIAILHGSLYLWHAHLDDLVLPGWITPEVPLLRSRLNPFPKRFQGCIH